MRSSYTCTSCASGTILGALATTWLAPLTVARPAHLDKRLHKHREKHHEKPQDEFAVTLLSSAERLSLVKHAAPDIYTHLPLRFEPNLSSPCWRLRGELACLPAFFIAGGMQCGTDLLWQRHPASAKSIDEICQENIIDLIREKCPEWEQGQPLGQN